MLDRFSDGREDGFLGNDGSIIQGQTAQFGPEDIGNAIQTPHEAAAWNDAGGRFVGGTIKGLTSKIGYLQRLGVTAIWVSPLFRQVPFEQSYHGYGIQNFLEVDPHFGTLQDLKTMVDTAHQHGIRVILDIILNHTGNVFEYDADRYVERRPDGSTFIDPRWDGNLYRARGFRDRNGHPGITFASVDLGSSPRPSLEDGVWPAELYEPAAFTCKGRISNWDHDPEFLEGDFVTLKNIHLGEGPADHYGPSKALRALAEVYKYWIAVTDIDGFRVDTVKHMDLGATRYFASVIHDFTQSIGKENFYLIGEITGGRARAFTTLEQTGVDAALGIDDIPDKLEGLVKGYRDPGEYFGLFRNSFELGKDSHVWFRDKVVTLYDDHDQIRKGEHKARFCSDDAGKKLALPVLAVNALTLGIPCIYYGSEQCLDGQGGNDRFIREAMFGGAFGPFRSRQRHVFSEEGTLYRELGKILALRSKKENIGLRRGRQYLREISGDGVNFGLPRVFGPPMRSVVAWSRLFNDREHLVAINTDPDRPTTAWVTIDEGLHIEGSKLSFIYSSEPGQMGSNVVVERRNGKAVQLTVPPGGVVILR